MKFEPILLGILLALGLGSDALKSFLPMGSGLATALLTVLSSLSLGNIPIVATNLTNMFQVWVGGAMGDPFWYVLGTIGMLSIPSLRGRFGMLLATWFACESFGTVLVNQASYLQARFITDVPPQIFAAVGGVAILSFLLALLQDGTRPGMLQSKLLTGCDARICRRLLLRFRT